MNHNPQVQLGNTLVTGVYEDGGLASFRSIPFAKADRWQKAEPVELCCEHFDATSFGAVPVQGPPAPFFAQRSGELTELPLSEDCLNVCVWSGDLETQNKPILLWIYGGAYIAGYNYRKGFTPEGFAKAHPEILVISPNYRVGVLGSLNLSGLSNDPKYRTSNNLALLDILEGLRWAHKYAAAFGGDPGRITVYGHSAGSNAISHLLTLPSAVGLFQRAICQSSFMTDLGTVELDTSREIADVFFAEAGAATLEDALTLTPGQILAAQKTLFRHKFSGKPCKMFSPVVDNITVFPDGFKKFVDGSYHGDALMIGGSEGEYDQNFWSMSLEETKAAVIARNQDKGISPEDIDHYISLFPERDAKESCLSVHNNLGLTLGGEWIARAACRHKPVYDYQFTLRSDGGEHRALHGDPTYYVFGTLMDKSAPSDLSQKMMDAWAAFVKTGDPNCPGIPTWPQLSEDRSVMTIGQSWKVRPGYFDRDYAFWFDRFAEKRYLESEMPFFAQD